MQVVSSKVVQSYPQISGLSTQKHQNSLK
jgi:hypothetical protein